jgi:hypothetical protein
MIEIISSDDFFELQSKFKQVPFTQSKGWYKYLKAQGKKVVFFTNDKSNDVRLLFFATTRTLPVVNKTILFIDGEVYKDDLSEKVFKKSFFALKALGYSGIEINSNNPYIVEYEIGIRRAGYIRPLGSFSCPLTIDVDLSKAPNFSSPWTRDVKKAVKNELEFSEVIKLSDEIVDEVVEVFCEMADLKKLNYKLESISLKSLLQSEDIRLFVVQDANGKILSARIIHVSYPFSSDIFAANSITSRSCGAAYFIMQNIFEILHEEGFKHFDFGRIPPSDHATDNIYQFKSLTGDSIQYNGNWSFYENKWLEFLMFCFKNFKLKLQRY